MDPEREISIARQVAEADWERDVPRLILFAESVLSAYRRWFPFQFDDASADRYVFQAVAVVLAGSQVKPHGGHVRLFPLLCVVIQNQIENDAEQSEWAALRQNLTRFPA
jgi:hypothetical protein